MGGKSGRPWRRDTQSRRHSTGGSSGLVGAVAAGAESEMFAVGTVASSSSSLPTSLSNPSRMHPSGCAQAVAPKRRGCASTRRDRSTSVSWPRRLADARSSWASGSPVMRRNLARVISALIRSRICPLSHATSRATCGTQERASGLRAHSMVIRGRDGASEERVTHQVLGFMLETRVKQQRRVKEPTGVLEAPIVRTNLHGSEEAVGCRPHCFHVRHRFHGTEENVMRRPNWHLAF